MALGWRKPFFPRSVTWVPESSQTGKGGWKIYQVGEKEASCSLDVDFKESKCPGKGVHSASASRLVPAPHGHLSQLPRCVVHSPAPSAVRQTVFASVHSVGEQRQQDTVGAARLCTSVWGLSWDSSARLGAGVSRSFLTPLSCG